MDKFRMVPHENSGSSGKSFLFILHLFFNRALNYPDSQWIGFNSDWHQESKEWGKGIMFIWQYLSSTIDSTSKIHDKD